ncbi:RnfABCDGE type electron transport complex subunit B [Candidatus Omnitrophota bacterium]
MEQIITALISLGSIGLLFAVVLSILDTKLTVEEDPLVKEVFELLPGINCGACSFAGCKAYAKAVVQEKNLFKGCLPGGEAVNAQIARAVGLETLCASTPLKVVVHCGSTSAEKKASHEYRGPKSCGLADMAFANIDCRYGCMGLGDCVGVCPTRALQVVSGLVRVDYTRCIGCGQCTRACPRSILRLVDASAAELYVVSCSNPEKGPLTKKVCSKGCIGCGICVKMIKDSPFHLEEGLSRIDYDKIKAKKKEELDLAKDKCPVKIINAFDLQAGQVCVRARHVNGGRDV